MSALGAPGEGSRQRLGDRQCLHEGVEGHDAVRTYFVRPKEMLRAVAATGAQEILESFFRHAVGLDIAAPRGFSLFNASINTFSVAGDGEWGLMSWGDTRHLGDLGTMDDW